jgi:hypothetical protein
MDLARRSGKYDAMIASFPSENMQFSACARTADGIVVFDICPSKAVFDEFGPELRAVLEAHGLGAPISGVDYPIDGGSPDENPDGSNVS